MIQSELHKGLGEAPDIFHVRVELDNDFYAELENGRFSGIGAGIVAEIVKNIYPEMEKRILSDPTFKDRIINEVLLMIANKVADIKINEQNNTNQAAS